MPAAGVVACQEVAVVLPEGEAAPSGDQWHEGRERCIALQRFVVPRLLVLFPAQRSARATSAGGHPKGQRKQVASGKRNNLTQQKRNVAGPAGRTQARQKGLGAASALGLGAAGAVAGKGVARNLPVSKAVAGSAVARGRVAVPPNVRPRLTLVKAPAAHLRPRFAPFVQRHWRRAFFWAAVAGVGYLTIPQLYYDRFYGCVNVSDPDYGCAADLLSAAALEEENDAARVHYPMPSDAVIRYSASAAPSRRPRAVSNPS